MTIAPDTPFGRLVVLGDAPRNKWGQRQYECRCACGTVTRASEVGLKSGSKKSCGCWARENQAWWGGVSPRHQVSLPPSPPVQPQPLSLATLPARFTRIATRVCAGAWDGWQWDLTDREPAQAVRHAREVGEIVTAQRRDEAGRVVLLGRRR